MGTTTSKVTAPSYGQDVAYQVRLGDTVASNNCSQTKPTSGPILPRSILSVQALPGAFPSELPARPSKPSRLPFFRLLRRDWTKRSASLTLHDIPVTSLQLPIYTSTEEFQEKITSGPEHCGFQFDAACADPHPQSRAFLHAKGNLAVTHPPPPSPKPREITLVTPGSHASDISLRRPSPDLVVERLARSRIARPTTSETSQPLPQPTSTPEIPTMGPAFRRRSSRLAKAPSEPYEAPIMTGTRKAPQPRRNNRNTKRQDDAYVPYPDLRSALVEQSSSRIATLEQTQGRIPMGEGSATYQELLDRELAAQLQVEEELAAYYDTYRDREPFAPRSGNRQSRRGTSIDPIDISSDEDEATVSLLSENDRRMEDADAVLAQQYQNEKHAILKHEARSTLRECAICGDDVVLADLASLARCKHQSDTCKDCFKQYLTTHIGSTPWNRITCPSLDCKVILQHHEVQQYAVPQDYERFDDLSARDAMNAEEGLIWCKSPGCGFGQIHVSADEGNIFRCGKCGFRMCVLCENINGWHEGETCEEYQYRVSGKKEAEQQEQIKASEKMIKKMAKKCPNKGCGYHIEKISGCDHMICQRCGHEFCWACLVPYSLIRRHGNSRHSGGCPHYA